MECPTCGYAIGPLDRECRRCAQQGEQTAPHGTPDPPPAPDSPLRVPTPAWFRPALVLLIIGGAILIIVKVIDAYNAHQTIQAMRMGAEWVTRMMESQQEAEEALRAAEEALRNRP